MPELPFQTPKLPVQMTTLFWLLIKVKISLPKVTGQNERQGKNLTRQLRILAGHCPLTRRYFAP